MYSLIYVSSRGIHIFKHLFYLKAMSHVKKNYDYCLSFMLYTIHLSLYYYDTLLSERAFGEVCSGLIQCDTTSDPNMMCKQTIESNMNCLCKDGMYKPSSSSCTDSKYLIGDSKVIGKLEVSG